MVDPGEGYCDAGQKSAQQDKNEFSFRYGEVNCRDDQKDGPDGEADGDDHAE